jgi:hypothetical protein
VSVDVQKNAQTQALITILDSTGPDPGPDHSPVVTSLVAPLSAQVDDQATLTATAMDADGDALTFSWTASPAACVTFTTPTASSTTFTAKLIGTCTVTFSVTANGKSDSKSASIAISAATGTLGITATFVPQPVIGSISFSQGATLIATVARSGLDATIRAPFHQGTAYTVTVTFDAPADTLSLSDSCAGTIVQPVLAASATSATATWTPTVSSGVCIVTATLGRATLIDTLFVVVLPVP